MIPGTLARLCARWRRSLRLAGLGRAVALGLPPMTVAALIPWTAGRALLAGLGTAVASASLWRDLAGAARFSPEAMARHLDRTSPSLQESASLLLRAPEGLAPLARLQRERVLAALESLDPSPLPRAPLRRAALWAVVSASLSVALALGGPEGIAALGRAGGTGAGPARAPAGAASLSGVRVRVEPPPYTGLPPRQVEGLDLAAEEGSLVSWRLQVEGEVDGARLLLEGEELPLSGGPSGGFRGERRAGETVLYRVSLLRGGREVFRSRLARLESIRDRPPELRVVRPEPVVEVDPAAPGTVSLEVLASDDHGLADAAIVATLALGSGERVEFRERRLRFDRPPGGKGATLTRSLDLEELGMVPGSELYLRAEAEDNRRPEPNRSRTSTLRLILPGGAGPAADLAAGLPVVELPEYFRSQRQIILDTEKLLAEQDRLTGPEFAYRSQIIGHDQSLLRVRYGGLLGEEFEDGNPLGDGVEDPEDPDHPGHGEESLAMTGREPEASGAEAVLEPFTHVHDSAESASFFPDRVRTTFRAMLARMWEAEERLRTVHPGEALPYEYEALRLLKSVQESSRVYVQKVGFEAPPLKPDEARLSGDLSEIGDQRVRRDGGAAGGEPGPGRLLSLLRSGGPELAEGDRQALERTREQLARRVKEDRNADLRALDLIDLLREAAPRLPSLPPADRAVLEEALWGLLPPPSPRPSVPAGREAALYDEYRRRLQEGGR